ncbi:hypothetical protein L7F22_031602 [Adiantum nelumboides]|nr:hypothetical protein [Adiantum nelumboides]
MTRDAANGHGLDLPGLQGDPSYSRLQHVDDLELEEFENPSLPTNAGFTRRRWWVKAFFWTLLLLAVTAVLVVWVFPAVLDKVLIPLMEWEASTFSRPVLALILITSLAVLPIFLFPSGPSMWLAGMTFGYGLGFLIIMAGMFVGVSLPFFIARWLFQARIQRWIQKWPKRAALIRIADQGGWFQQFRVLLVLRVSPIPYALFNYAIATTNVKYGPYICSSCAILIPESFITIYSGRLLKTLAEMKSSKQHLTPLQITYNVLGFFLAVGVTIGVTIYGKRALQELEIREEATRRESAAELESFPPSRMNGGLVTIVGLSQESIQIQAQSSSLDSQEKMQQSK